MADGFSKIWSPSLRFTSGAIEVVSSLGKDGNCGPVNWGIADTLMLSLEDGDWSREDAACLDGRDIYKQLDFIIRGINEPSGDDVIDKKEAKRIVSHIGKLCRNTDLSSIETYRLVTGDFDQSNITGVCQDVPPPFKNLYSSRCPLEITENDALFLIHPVVSETYGSQGEMKRRIEILSKEYMEKGLPVVYLLGSGNFKDLVTPVTRPDYFVKSNLGEMNGIKRFPPKATFSGLYFHLCFKQAIRDFLSYHIAKKTPEIVLRIPHDGVVPSPTRLNKTGDTNSTMMTRMKILCARSEGWNRTLLEKHGSVLLSGFSMPEMYEGLDKNNRKLLESFLFWLKSYIEYDGKCAPTGLISGNHMQNYSITIMLPGGAKRTLFPAENKNPAKEIIFDLRP